MIRVSFMYDGENNPVAFRCDGHAGFAKKGRDIVCAAVSMLTINTVNSIEKFTEDKFLLDYDEKNGYMYFRFSDGVIPSDDSLLLLKSLELGITQAAHENKSYINLTEWEV